MIVFPAMDLKDGQVVRLVKGAFDTVHPVASDPLATARAFLEAGARWAHMVDLDGAKDGARRNGDIVAAVAATGLSVQLGGGIRSMADLEAVFALGVRRAVIGSAAVSDPGLVKAAVERFGPDRVAVGLDVRGDSVRTAGWTADSGLFWLDFARRMEALGAATLIFTDIDTDGTLAGPSFDKLAQLRRAVKCDIIASGGVSSDEDLAALAKMGLYGAIVGKAYYAGRVDLARVIREVQP
ncbi:MAG TPA: 1-(5-phosphoribosyl)-5-[(5-phosphoribosylamino)methylideneamino]imidazole-4-carboxamide isomerase [Candidatus Fournierella merdigallinarum]|nr:1-(5-phosphoribosyl)-5-[(5-phosphoribosylamino)methylideneamino]imidazole-4-carboxamide isomerase [Candidatus Fournierella merdigallinarum]